MNFFTILKLLISFLTDKTAQIRRIHNTFLSIPAGTSIGHYLSTTFINSPNRDNSVILRILKTRSYGNHNLPMANLSQREIGYLKCRNNFLIQNQHAYNLAWIENPTVQQLEDFSRMDQRWSILIAIKTFLIHNPEMAKKYRGFLPYGGPVAAFMSKALERNIDPSPSLAEHIELMNITNAVAEFLKITTVEVNTMFYLEGLANNSITPEEPQE